jgi:hypothetical protein
MNKYFVIDQAILIMASPAGKDLYESSKSTINENSSLIDSHIKNIKFCELLLNQFKTLKVSYAKDLTQILLKRIDFLKLHCFFLNFSIDISISLRELMLSTNKPEQIFYIKSIYIELYRFLEKLNNYLGIIKKFKIAEDEYKDYTQSLQEFRSRYYQTIKTTRNDFFAHLDKHEYSDYYNIIIKLDPEEIAKMCINFLHTNAKLSSLLLDILKQQTNQLIELNERSKLKRIEIQKTINEIFERIKTQLSEDEYINLKSQLDNIF